MASVSAGNPSGSRLRDRFAPVDPLGPRRQDYLDNLKVCLTMLVIMHHCAIAFGAVGDWVFTIDPRGESLSVLVMTFFTAINQAFFMSLFFGVAGYFTPAAFDRKGPSRFLSNRVARLGVPMVLYFFLIDPTVNWMALRFEGVTGTSYAFFMGTYGHRFFGLGVTWFLFALLLFALGYAGVRMLREAPVPPQRPRPFPSHLAIFSFIFGMGLITFFVRIGFPAGEVLPYVNLNIGEFPLYLAGWIAGIKSWRHGWVEMIDFRRMRVWLIVAVVAILLLPPTILFGVDSEESLQAFLGGFSSLSFLYSLWQTTLFVGISLGLLYLFRTHLAGTGPLPRALAHNAYAAYIIHPLFVVPLTELVAQFPTIPLIHFLLLFPLAISASFLAGGLLRRLPILRRVL
jgi:glucan biosynthesis protein C